jgi:arginase
MTAVELEDGYECHVCGRTYLAALVRVPRAWGKGGDAMAQAAESLPLPYPDAAVVEEDTLATQTLAVASELPGRPIVVGGCCCAHVGAVEGLSSRCGRLGVVWLDAHGDLNTPETSPSGNAWGMPLRMAIDSGAVRATDVTLVGARNLDPPEEDFIAASGLHRDDVSAALEGCDAVYVALDTDVLRPGELTTFMPEPGGPTLAEVEELLRGVVETRPLAGAGVLAFLPDARNAEPITRLLAALGL